MKPFLTHYHSSDACGFSVMELLIVVAMIAVITGFALIQIVEARQDMTRENAAQLLAVHLEKARLDSLRRHPGIPDEMAQVSIINESFYSFTIDADGNGTLDAPQVVSLPAGSNLQFNDPYPRTIYFNWRGRTVDSGGNVATPEFVSITHSHGSNRIDLSSAGEASFDGAPPASSAVTNSAAPAPEFRNDTHY